MGAINSAFNQAAGAVAGAALAVKYAKEKDESKVDNKENSALIARNQARSAEIEAMSAYRKAIDEEIPSKIKDAQKAEEEAKKAFDKSMNRKNGSQKTRSKRFTE